MELRACPQCGHPAEIDRRDLVDSTDGPVELVKVTCVLGHWFLLSADWLDRSVPRSADATAGGRTGGGI